MANYYHEARAHARRLKELSDESKRRAERRAEFVGAQVDPYLQARPAMDCLFVRSQAEYPLNVLTVEGHGVKIHEKTELSNQLKSGGNGGGMIQSYMQPEVTIDRYDGRALLDCIVECKKADQREESEIDKMVLFEAYRDLIRVNSWGLSEMETLQLVENENVELRAAAKVHATQSQGFPPEARNISSLDLPPSISSKAAAEYGSTAVLLDEYASSESCSDEDSSGCKTRTSSDNQRKSGAGKQRPLLDRDVLDLIAVQQFAIHDFSHKLRKVLKVENDHTALAELKSSKSSRVFKNRGLITERSRVGQSLNEAASSASARSSHRRWSSTKTKYGDESSESEIEGNRGQVAGKTEFITCFSGGQHQDTNPKIKEYRDFWEPESSSQELTGTEPSSQMHDPTRLDFAQRAQARKRKLQEAKELERLKSDESARQFLQGKKRTSKDKDKVTEKKETVKERMKRLTAAQLNKQAKKDAIQMTQKRLQAQKDQQARAKIEQSYLEYHPHSHKQK